MAMETERGRPVPPSQAIQPPSFLDFLKLSRRELSLRIREEIERNPLIEERTHTLAQDRSDAVQGLSSIERFAFLEELPPTVDPEKTAEVMGPDADGELEWEEPPWSDPPAIPAPATTEELADALLAEGGGPAHPPTLYDHLLVQVRLGPFSWAEQRVATLILQNLDEDGYLRMDGVEGDPLIPIAAEAEVGLGLAARTLRKLQDLEPPGVCARDLVECLTIQARARGEESGVVGAVIRKHLPTLQAKSLRSIAADLNVELSEVLRAERVIAEMNPRPGLLFGGDAPITIQPDLSIVRSEDEYAVTVDDPLSRFRISQRYRAALRGGKAQEPGTEAFLRDHLFRATAMIAAVHERQQLLYQLGEAIVALHRAFLDRGPAALDPRPLGQLAQAAGIQAAMVRRVSTAKYVGTPYGVLPMARFILTHDERVA